MLANWLVAEALDDVSKQQQIVYQYKIKSKVDRTYLKFSTNRLLRRPDTLGLVFLAGCLKGKVRSKDASKVVPLITFAINLVQLGVAAAVTQKID